VCWPTQSLFWAAFAWPCIAASVASIGLLAVTAISPGIAVAEANKSQILPGSWDRDSGATTTMLYTALQALMWALVAMGAYVSDGETALVVAAVVGMLQGLLAAFHQFVIRADGRIGCAAVLTCQARPPPPSSSDEETPEDDTRGPQDSFTIRDARRKVLSHLFESESSAKVIAKICADSSTAQHTPAESCGQLSEDGGVKLFGAHDVIYVRSAAITEATEARIAHLHRHSDPQAQGGVAAQHVLPAEEPEYDDHYLRKDDKDGYIQVGGDSAEDGIGYYDKRSADVAPAKAGHEPIDVMRLGGIPRKSNESVDTEVEAQKFASAGLPWKPRVAEGRVVVQSDGDFRPKSKPSTFHRQRTDDSMDWENEWKTSHI
jgi:hypothetical protein